jgi:hypothetical protein
MGFGLTATRQSSQKKEAHFIWGIITTGSRENDEKRPKERQHRKSGGPPTAAETTTCWGEIRQEPGGGTGQGPWDEASALLTRRRHFDKKEINALFFQKGSTNKKRLGEKLGQQTALSTKELWKEEKRRKRSERRQSK